MREVLLYEIKHGIVMDIIVSPTAGRQVEWRCAAAQIPAGACLHLHIATDKRHRSGGSGNGAERAGGIAAPRTDASHDKDNAFSRPKST